MEVLGGWATGEQTEPDIRIRAIAMLLDRGWGKAPQPHTGEDGEGAVELVIRKLFEEKKRDDAG